MNVITRIVEDRPKIDKSPEAVELRRRAGVSARASNEMEGLYDDGACADIFEAYELGEIDGDEARRQILARYARN